MTRTFVNYGTDYQQHEGLMPLSEFSRDRQDELIRLMFDPNSDAHEWIMRNDVEHEQPDGLWAVIAAIGMRLEQARAIPDFTQLDAKGKELVLDFISGTNLGRRLEEAFQPYSETYPLTDYDWAEAALFSTNEAIYELSSATDLHAALRGYLAPAPEPTNGVYRRLSHDAFRQGYDAKQLTISVDRSLAVQEFGRSSAPSAGALAIGFWVCLLAALPLMIFLNFWIGAATLVAAVISKKLLTGLAVSHVRAEALNSRERYQTLAARHVVWAEKT